MQNAPSVVEPGLALPLQFATPVPLAFDVSSFQDNGDRTARMSAHRDRSSTWTVHLILVDEAVSSCVWQPRIPSGVSTYPW
ncbi:hypothetical protein C8D87_1161 [Lentzea atacamensis]|uniref:Uncharacterized protein n=1 Tax=Lentzea atacamensis TaxID=531938 RepID=A0ABX9DY61_9PSEU|nr:hypothetical protein C8D87_1161 [Lentzea atacamensis]